MHREVLVMRFLHWRRCSAVLAWVTSRGVVEKAAREALLD
jgi:hypothetical protein